MCLKIQLLIKHSLLFIILFLLTPNSLFSIDTKNRRPPVDLTKSSWYIKEGFSENYIKSENFNISEYQEFKEFPLVLNKIFKNPSGNIQLKEYTKF